MRATHGLVALVLVGAGVTSICPSLAQAAPLVSNVTRVGPDALTAAIVLDASADNRWVLAGGFGVVQRIDRQGNSATAPLPTPSLDLAITDDGNQVIAVDVAAAGEVTILRTDPVTAGVTEVVVGNLGPGQWSRVGPISISATGRFVAFAAAEGLGFGQTVVVADTQGPFTLTRADGLLPGGATRRSASPSLSADGRFVAFSTSTAPVGCTNGPGCGEVWVRDLATGAMHLATVRSIGGSSGGVAPLTRLSANGRFVTFVSDAVDLAAGTPNRADRVYVRDLQANLTKVAAGRPSAGPFGARAPSVSDDGRLVAFTGRGTANLGGNPTEVDQVLVADLADGSVVQAALRPNGGFPDSNSTTPLLRADGSEVVFASSATNLLTAPTLGGWRLFATRIGGPESAGSGQTLARARFVPMSPARVLDTRDGTGGWPAGVRPGVTTTVTVRVAGVVGVPAGASAVVLNVTATDAAAPGYVTVHPGGTPRPLASNLNIGRAGQTIPNLVVVPVGSGGLVSLFTQQGTHLVADVLGYFLPANQSDDGRYRALPPGRLLDTRDGTGGWPAGIRPGAGQVVSVPVLGRGGVPARGVSAVVLNVTATQAARAGFVTVYPGATPRPFASNLNLEAPGQTIANLVMVPVGPNGAVEIFTQYGTHLVVDVAGWFTDATAPSSASGLFVPFRPVRLSDTRTPFSRFLPPVSTARYRATVPPLPGSGVSAALLNVTVTETTGPGFVTVHPAGTPRPLASNLNVERAGQTIPNAVVATLNDGSFDLFTLPGTHVVIDASGYFRS